MRSKVLVLLVTVLLFSCVANADIAGGQGFGAILLNSNSGDAVSSNLALINQDLRAVDRGSMLCANEIFIASQNADTTRRGSALQYMSGSGAQGGFITDRCRTSSLSGDQLLCLEGVQQNTGGVVAQGGVTGQSLIVAGRGEMIAASQMAGFAQFSGVSGGRCSNAETIQSVSIILGQGAVVN